MKFLALFASFLSLASHATGYTSDEVRKFAQQPRAEVELSEPLKIFPTASLLDVEVSFLGENGKVLNTVKYPSRQKVISEDMIVASWKFPGIDHTYISVLEYDVVAGVYRNWQLSEDGKVHELIGAAVTQTRSISWQPKLAPKDRSFGLFSYIDNGWQSQVVYFNADGTIRMTLTNTAVAK